jgi:hypothetical protein
LGWATLSLLLCPALLLQLKGLAMEKTKKVSASYLKVSSSRNFYVGLLISLVQYRRVIYLAWLA